MAQELDLASTMNSQSDFADLKSRFFNQLCPCGKSDRAHFSYIEEDGEILLRECTKCRDVIGLDDSTYDGASTMNSQTDFADLKSRFFNQLCRCGNGDRSHFSYVKVDGEILMRECKKCHDIIGLDDSTYDEVLSWLGDTENIRVSLCDCGNENPYAFVFEQLDDDAVLRCGKCRKVIWLSSQESTEDVGQPHGHKKVDPKSGEGRTRDWVSSLGSTEAGGHPHGHKKVDPKSGDCRKTNHVSSDVSTEAVGHPYSQTKIDPKSAWKLRPGDHITWERLDGINHHAIVVRCSNFDYTYVQVIHYTSPEGKAKMTEGVVVENWVDLFKQNGELYRVEYKPESLDSDEVIARAQSLLGKDEYNIFTNNCEHFARWCKTGIGACEQVKSAGLTMLSTGAKDLEYKPESLDSDELISRAQSQLGKDRCNLFTNKCKNFARWCKTGIGACEQVKSAGLTMLTTGSTNLIGTGLKAGAEYGVENVKSLSPLGGALTPIGVAAIVGIELYSLAHDLKKAKEQLRDDEIYQHECIKIVVERGCCLAITVAGAVAGSFIPIPIVGSLIGSTLGSLIGKYVGRLMKRLTSKAIAAIAPRKTSVLTKETGQSERRTD